MNKVIIIPHVEINGGAGLYIKKILSKLREYFEVSVAGKFSQSYSCATSENIFFHEKFVFPNYQGVSLIRKNYHLIRLVLNLLIVLSEIKNKKNLAIKSTIVLTSGIQMPLLWLYKKIYPNAKLIILIQENWILENNIYGKISKLLLHQADEVISITKKWSEYAALNNIKSTVYRNEIDNDFVIDLDSGLNIIYDALYIGGDQRIKGFNSLVRMYRKISDYRKIIICIAGQTNEKSRKIINDLNAKSKNGSMIECVGQVNSIQPLLMRSKFLLLPIMAPHFQRAALEAGFCRKTFLIRNFHVEDDFLDLENNCLSYSDDDDLIAKFLLLLDDDELRSKLELNNEKFFKSFTEENIKNFPFSYVKNKFEIE